VSFGNEAHRLFRIQNQDVDVHLSRRKEDRELEWWSERDCRSIGRLSTLHFRSRNAVQCIDYCNQPIHTRDKVSSRFLCSLLDYPLRPSKELLESRSFNPQLFVNPGVHSVKSILWEIIVYLVVQPITNAGESRELDKWRNEKTHSKTSVSSFPTDSSTFISRAVKVAPSFTERGSIDTFSPVSFAYSWATSDTDSGPEAQTKDFPFIASGPFSKMAVDDCDMSSLCSIEEKERWERTTSESSDVFLIVSPREANIRAEGCAEYCNSVIYIVCRSQLDSGARNEVESLPPLQVHPLPARFEKNAATRGVT